ncbi:MAG: carboxylating nicotinate-nucleotide diphosphorylase [Candidatus Omnitrophica bacterium]|nr:carboxylating nicotinate-nucleotide diphosphorylase [Candidatus Omnitrophota bacterium]
MLNVNELNMKRVERIVRFTIKEDVWTGDITSDAVLDAELEVDAVILSRQKGIVCGMAVAEKAFNVADPDIRFRPMVKDGEKVEPDREIAFIEGNAQAILRVERVALNFLSYMSGIATETGKFVELVKDTGVKIFDTRKTLPLHRYLQKYAVRIGGGHNHRWGLWDMVLIKDNHLRAFGMQRKTRNTESIVKNIIRAAREDVQKNILVEIEVETLKECEYALSEKPDVIMLDNMKPDLVVKAVELRKKLALEKTVKFEVSGGITLDNVRSYASTGVDIISSGSLTSRPNSLDFSLEVILRDK